MRVRLFGAVAASLFLGSCGALEDKSSCTSADAQAVVSNIVSTQIEKSVLAQLGDVGGEVSNAPTASKVRATVALLKVVLEDIRTTKTDPNSTKKFCEAKLKIVVPLNIITDAERARSALSAVDIGALAEKSGIDRSADTFSYNATYSVQPTDDKKKVYGELDTPGNQFSFFGELLAFHLLEPQITAKQQSAAAEEQAAAEALSQQQSAQSQADAELAREENLLATQTINEIWNALPDDQRRTMLGLQRAWIKKKEIECNIASAQVSTDVNTREAARLRCDTQYTNQRARELRQLLEG